MGDPQKRMKLTMNGGIGHLEIGGVDISAATRSVELRVKAGDLPEVMVDLSVIEVEIDGEAEFKVLPVTRDALIALGWTPPQE